MLLRHEMVNELVLASEPLAEDAARTPVNVAEEAARTVVRRGHVAGQLAFAAVRLAALAARVGRDEERAAIIGIGQVKRLVVVAGGQRGRLTGCGASVRLDWCRQVVVVDNASVVGWRVEL
jgi:hypothetical protein